jgi:hypothetical protein
MSQPAKKLVVIAMSHPGAILDYGRNSFFPELILAAIMDS